MITLYGIPNCNTVKKALDWLKAQQIDYTFHDFKKKGITTDRLEAWAKQVGWEALVNKRGTTWKQLPLEIQQGIQNKEAAFELILQKTSVTKRPILESKKGILLGFDDIAYATYFAKK
ncbi:MAG: ArsC family reductase [Sphingobacteriales bacterium]|jgi:Spx/MgsR family transcriptional regulator|nr:ArsC family reductase [Sphingobacteriales bacterium]